MSELANFKPTCEMIQSANCLLAAKAFLAEIDTIVNGYGQKILAEKQWPIAQKWVAMGMDKRVILEPKSAFLLSPEHLKTYYELTFIEREKAGLKVSHPENCPLLEAKTLELEAKKAFLDATSSITGVSFEKAASHSIKLLDQLTELTLALMVPYLKPEEWLQIPRSATESSISS